MRVFASAMVCAAGLAGAVSAGGPAAAIDRLAWLQGCWRLESAKRIVEEHWMAPRGGSMMGMSRTVRGDRLSEYELVVVRERDGRLAFEAHPSGQPSAVFLSRLVEDARVVFENKEHDFPQEVGYERAGPDGALAWIAGVADGEPRRVEFRYQRVPSGESP
jgi:hypothetical protein